MTTRKMSQCFTMFLVMLTVCAQLATPATAAERTSRINDPQIYVDPGISMRSAQRQQVVDQSVLRGMQAQAAALNGLTNMAAGSSNATSDLPSGKFLPPRRERIEVQSVPIDGGQQTTRKIPFPLDLGTNRIPTGPITPPVTPTHRNRVDRVEMPLPRSQPPFRPPTTGQPSVRVGGGTR